MQGVPSPGQDRLELTCLLAKKKKNIKQKQYCNKCKKDFKSDSHPQKICKKDLLNVMPFTLQVGFQALSHQ